MFPEQQIGHTEGQYDNEDRSNVDENLSQEEKKRFKMHIHIAFS